MTLEELKEKKVSAISLGCDKNRVDLEKMLYNIKNFGFTVTENPLEAQIIIVNTCAFIGPAVSEAIENIIAVILEKQNRVEKVIVTGCLVNRYEAELKPRLTEVDAFVQVKDNDKIVDVILGLYNLSGKYKYKNGRLITNLPHYAYLKIADGCDNGCAYCTIPRIRGRYRSTPMEELVVEAKDLAKQGVKELILVAQDITRYGIDIYDEYKLIPLIKELSKIKGIKWIRLHYCYPEMVTDELLKEIVTNPKVCKYIDVPMQHIDDKILKEMNRRSSEQDIRNLVANIKQNYPEIAIRTTFIVGFPGETRKQFNKLLDFLKEARLNNVGFFAYCKEEKTKAYFMKKQVSNFVKRRRLKKAQTVQEQVANALNIDIIGQAVDVIVDAYDDEVGYYIGRTQQNSPEVDFVVLLEENPNIKYGEIFKAKITDYTMGVFKGEII
ncbi:MAG: 30S ribosomal protein S12 methylthiotransferase RimO [Clostridiales bacterium]|nr:30S ribosomal protein S12 methylthiotransferase RimO [Clostridiales bacterium]